MPRGGSVHSSPSNDDFLSARSSSFSSMQVGDGFGVENVKRKRR